MTGHRRRMQLVLPHYATELLCGSKAIVGPYYNCRTRKHQRRIVRGLCRAWQARQDRRERREQEAL